VRPRKIEVGAGAGRDSMAEAPSHFDGGGGNAENRAAES
jgi:hypothetical protein